MSFRCLLGLHRDVRVGQEEHTLTVCTRCGDVSQAFRSRAAFERAVAVRRAVRQAQR